jgi:tetratricopeptide (TPR) repeat protein
MSIEIFYSYSHRDEAMRDELEKHLTLLKRNNVIAAWHDRCITAGDEWKSQIDDHLRSAQIILLLISSDFLASDYCYDIEMELALERHARGEAIVVPVILRSVDWTGAKFAHLQALPKNAKPVHSWPDPDEAFTDVAQGIRKLASQLQPQAHHAASSLIDLPPSAAEFFGREDELKRLIQRLREKKNTAVVGFAGMGKTALAAKALATVVGETTQSLAASPYPGGVVFLDLYTAHGAAEPAWDALANKLSGPNFLERSPARERAANACQRRDILVVIEGGEEANGLNGHARIEQILEVLSPQNRWLLLTRLSIQADAADSIRLREALSPASATDLFDSLTKDRVPPVPPAMRDEVLKLLDGHPLALTWAGKLLANEDESATLLIRDWKREQLPGLNDPRDAEHTLGWLFERSVASLDLAARHALDAAGILARAPFPLEAIESALADGERKTQDKDIARRALRSLVQSSLLGLTADDRWQFTHVLGYRFARKEIGSDAGVRERLGTWLHGYLTKVLAVNAPAEMALPLADALEHLGALLRTDEDQTLWYPLACAALYNFRDRLGDLGRLGQVRLTLNAVEGWFESLPEVTRQESKWLRERYSLAVFHGNMLQAQGDLAGAQAAFQRALEICQPFAAADPSNAQWQRDLSISHEKVGDILQAQGDLGGALAAFNESLRLIKPLTEADPANTLWQRHISISHLKVGDILEAQGDLDGAQAAFQRSLEIIEELTDADPSNTKWQRDLSVSHNKVGNILEAQGDLNGAQAAFQRGLEIRQRLASADSSNAQWQRDLSFSLTKIAQICERNGNRDEALGLAERSLKIDERLSALDPTNVMWRKDVAMSRRLVARLREGTS